MSVNRERMITTQGAHTSHVETLLSSLSILVKSIEEEIQLLSNHIHITDGYLAAYKPITLPRIFFIFIEMKCIYYHYCVMF